MKTRSFLFLSMLSGLMVTGCTRSPNVEIVGSYFPGWLLSLLTGVALTFAAHSVLRRKGLVHAVGHPAVIYPGPVLLFTCLLWLCFFG
jgi:hypothetical protein